LVFGLLSLAMWLPKEESSADAARLKELQKVALAAPLAAGADWPEWRGPRRDGVADSVSGNSGLLVVWPDGGPRKLWEVPTGEGFSAPAVTRGRVFIMVQDQDQEAIVCWDAVSGQELWRYRYPAHFQNPYGNGPRCTPTVDGDLIFIVGATGIMNCLRDHGDKAERLWTKSLLEEFGAANPPWGTAQSPLVEGDLVYINPGGPNGKSLVALDKNTGAVRWHSQDDPASDSSPMPANCTGRRQVIYFTVKGLVGVTPDEGKLLWRFPWETDFGANIATPIVAGDYVFLSSGYGKGCALVKIERDQDGLKAGQVYKNLKMKNHFATCVLFGEHVYGFDDTILTCMDFKTGKVAWKERGFDKGSLTIADGHLFVMGEYGKLAVATATPAGFHPTGSFQFSEKRCWTMPVIADGKMYVRNEEKLACYDLRR
jgi:outer membrane protein assembly factor BamB